MEYFARPVWPESLELSTDASESSWILPRLLAWGIGGTRVASVVPAGYEAYVRILHPAGAGMGQTVPWQTVAEATGSVFHPLVQFARIYDPEALGGNHWISAPAEGRLDADTCHLLYGLRAGWTATPGGCCFGIWDGWGSFGSPRSIGFFGPRGDGERRVEKELSALARRVARAPRFHHPDRDYLLARGPVTAACALIESFAGITPSLAWPSDRAWVVGTEIDFDSTLVACSAGCAAALLASPGLEGVPVQPDDRLDIDGDVINGQL